MTDTKDVTLEAKLGPQGWQVACPPGPLADLLAQLAAGRRPDLETARNEREDTALIPYTQALDEAIVDLVDALVTVRYDAGQVQLRLFSEEGLI